MSPIRILLVDDHDPLRAILCVLLSGQPDLDVVGETGNDVEAIKLSVELQPNVVLLDIGMGGTGGWDVLRRIKQAVPDTHVLVLGMDRHESYAQEALRAGASGYSVKWSTGAGLSSTICAIVHSELFLCTSFDKGSMG